MKKEISPAILIGAVVAVVAVVGYVAYRTFFVDPNYSPIQTEAARKEFEAAQKNDATYKRLGAHGGRGQ